MTVATTDPPSELDVVHDEEGHRYLLRRDGEHVGVIEYRIVPGSDGETEAETFEFHHTEVPPRLRGAGLAAVLVRRSLDDMRASGRRVVPSCWYVRDFIRDHPEYGSLLADR